MTETINGQTYRVLTEEEIYHDPDLPKRTITPAEFVAMELVSNAVTKKAIKEVNKNNICHMFTSGRTPYAIAKHFKISQTQVNQVLKERGHIGG